MQCTTHAIHCASLSECGPSECGYNPVSFVLSLCVACCMSCFLFMGWCMCLESILSCALSVPLRVCLLNLQFCRPGAWLSCGVFMVDNGGDGVCASTYRAAMHVRETSQWPRCAICSTCTCTCCMQTGSMSMASVMHCFLDEASLTICGNVQWMVRNTILQFNPWQYLCRLWLPATR